MTSIGRGLRTASLAALVAVGVLGALGPGGREVAPPTNDAAPAPPAARLGPRPPADAAAEARDPSRLSAGLNPEPFDAWPGQRFHFDVWARWRTRIGTATDAVQAVAWEDGVGSRTIEASFAAQLFVVVLARELDAKTDRLVLRVSLAAPRLEARGVGELPASLEAEMLVRMSTTGRVLGYVFDGPAPLEARRMLLGLFARTHQFVVDTDEVQWTAEKLYDELGEFSATFGWRAPAFLEIDPASAVLHRRLLSYTHLTNGDALGARIHAARSRGEAAFSGGWLEAARVEEQRSGEVADLFRLRLAGEIGLDRRASDIVPLEPFTAPPAEMWRTELPEEGETPVGEAAGPVVTLDEALGALAELSGGDRLGQRDAFDAWRALATALGRDPEVLNVLAARLRDGSLDGDTARFAVSAIGLTAARGNPLAADVLANIIGDGSVGKELQLEAIVSAHQVTNHVAPVMAAAAQVLSPAGGAAADGLLASSAVLLLGSLAGAGTGSPDPGALGGLARARDWAFEVGAPGVYFAALANTQRPELMAEAFDHIGATDPEVRRGAVEVLGKLPEDPRTHGVLEGLATGDHDANVRRASIAALAEGAVSAEQIGTIELVATADTDAAVRVAAVSSLGGQALKGSRSALAALERLSSAARVDVSSLAARLLDDLAQADLG